MNLTLASIRQIQPPGSVGVIHSTREGQPATLCGIRHEGRHWRTVEAHATCVTCRARQMRSEA